ncbi:MAG TPA: hypothetical protein VN317_02760 [Candidatus Methanoperedens sp.]|nr:hypothetical protein [Candidatus Methanoperedens sp.]
MKRLFVVTLVLALAGCLAHVTPYGTTIEPLFDVYITGPPVVVEPPPAVVFQPLPPAVYVPDRRVYYYNNYYYYYWGDSWYWGRDRRGPWHTLQRKYWPPRVDPPRKGGSRGRGGDRPVQGGNDPGRGRPVPESQ